MPNVVFAFMAYDASTSLTQMVIWPPVEELVDDAFHAKLEMVQLSLKKDASDGVYK